MSEWNLTYSLNIFWIFWLLLLYFYFFLIRCWLLLSKWLFCVYIYIRQTFMVWQPCWVRIYTCCERIFVIIIPPLIHILHVCLLRHNFRRSHEGFPGFAACGTKIIWTGLKLATVVSNWHSFTSWAPRVERLNHFYLNICALPVKFSSCFFLKSAA